MNTESQPDAPPITADPIADRIARIEWKLDNLLWRLEPLLKYAEQYLAAKTPTQRFRAAMRKRD